MTTPGHEKVLHVKVQQPQHFHSNTVVSSQSTKMSGETVSLTERGDKGEKLEEKIHIGGSKASGRNLTELIQSQRTEEKKLEYLQTIAQTGVLEEAVGHLSESDGPPSGRNKSSENKSTQDSEHSANMEFECKGNPLTIHPDNFPASRGPAVYVAESPEGVTDQNLMKIQTSRRNAETTSDDFASQQLRAQEHGMIEEESQRQPRNKAYCNPHAQGAPRGTAKAVDAGLTESHTSVHKEPSSQKQGREVQEQRMMRGPINENQRLRSEYHSLWEEFQRAIHYIRELESVHSKYKQNLSYQNRLLQQLDQEKHSLSQQIEKLELQNAQQSVAETGSYEDLTATPPLLQTAVDAVKEALGIFASDIFKEMKSHAISVNYSHPDLGGEMKAAQTKIILQSEICTAFFTSFENQAFGIPTAMPLFVRPKEQKQKFYKLYQDLRYVDLPQIYKQDDFHQFVDTKRGNLLNHAESLVFMDAVQRRHFLSNILEEDKIPIYSSFVRLGKAVWVLHKLAFAFEPTAEIFRVTKNSLFDEDYMKKINQDEDEDEERATEREVAFMVVPGFTVRNTVVKAHVCLKPPPPPPPKSLLSKFMSSFS